LIGKPIDVVLPYVDVVLIIDFSADPALDVASGRNVLSAAAEMIQRYDAIPSTAEGLLQAQDAIHHRMQANLHELRVACIAAARGICGRLDDIGRRLRELQG